MFTKKFSLYEKLFLYITLTKEFTIAIIAICLETKNTTDKSYYVTSGKTKMGFILNI
jgi:hypothetical protein